MSHPTDMFPPWNVTMDVRDLERLYRLSVITRHNYVRETRLNHRHPDFRSLFTESNIHIWERLTADQRASRGEQETDIPTPPATVSNPTTPTNDHTQRHPDQQPHISVIPSVHRLPTGQIAVGGVPLRTSASDNAYRGRDQGNPPSAAPPLPSAQDSAAPSLPPAQGDVDRRAPFTPPWRLEQQRQASARPQQQSVHQQETSRRQSLLASAHRAQVIRQTAADQASTRQQQVHRDRLSDQAPTATSALQDPVVPQPQSDEDDSNDDEEDEQKDNFKSYMISASAASHIHERDNDAVICVDSGSGVHLDRKLRPDTVDSAVPNYDKRLTIKGIDGRSLKVTHHGYIPGRGLFVVCPQAAADLLSVTELDREGHEVKFKDGTVHITDSKGTQIMDYRAKDHLLY
ncbi:hypothetical protein B484DRAFT_473560, partial [Ochromonadaceae sp. CCMP2298]